MEQVALMAVEDTPEVLQARLKREWETIEAQKQAGEVDYDVKRAQLLTTYLDLGMEQKEIRACVGINQGWLQALLRYGRFIVFLNSCEFKISEGRFRRYWAEIADHVYMSTFRRKQDKSTRMEYEQKVFQQIAAKILEGVKPTVPSTQRNKRVEDIQTEKLKDIRKSIETYQVLKRKEVKEAYRMIEEDVKALIALSGHSRSTYAPGVMAMHAKRLKEGFAALQKSLKGSVDQWLLDVM